MKIAHVTPGAGGMYCGSCLHDNTLAAALIREGHDVSLIPIYTPIRTDETDVSIDHVFYGAVNVYLEQRSALFRHTPRIVDRMLNSRPVLNWASARAGSTDATALGDLTLSVLLGEYGKQKKELERLVQWMGELQPDIVQLSNSMLVGMARRLRQALGVPVVCSVQGEDIFLDALKEPYRTRVRQTLRERARDADAFVATSRYYADSMTELLGIPGERMHHVPLGVKLDGFGTRERVPDERPFVIGYLARVCPEKGLHLLVEGFRRLVERVGRDSARLKIAGWLGERDRPYFAGIMQDVEAAGLAQLVEYAGAIDRQRKIEFLDSLHVLSVPTQYREPKGLFVLEALASGVPVVQPRHGAFPELIEATGGGLLVEPDSPDALADGLQQLMDDPERRNGLGRAGSDAVRRTFSDTAMARATVDVYRKYVAGA